RAEDSALDQLFTDSAEASIFQAGHRLYEHGNKPGRLLSRLAKNRTALDATPSLRTNRGGGGGRQRITKKYKRRIKSLNNGKSPVPDGFYKNCQDFLTEPLLRMYTRGKLPPMLNHADRYLLLKKNKPAIGLCLLIMWPDLILS
ncbi:unnamed protein product, partial [Coregonus sp. 'balchen']